MKVGMPADIPLTNKTPAGIAPMVGTPRASGARASGE
jgi:hypothetical protein